MDWLDRLIGLLQRKNQWTFRSTQEWSPLRFTSHTPHHTTPLNFHHHIEQTNKTLLSHYLFYQTSSSWSAWIYPSCLKGRRALVKRSNEKADETQSGTIIFAILKWLYYLRQRLIYPFLSFRQIVSCFQQNRYSACSSIELIPDGETQRYQHSRHSAKIDYFTSSASLLPQLSR